jgi:hypothetical protein
MLTKSPETAAPEVALWRPSGFADDGWVFVDSVDEMPPAGRVIVPLAVWREVRASNALDAWQIGVALAPDDVEDILPDLDHVALISLDFPKFTDGRPIRRPGCCASDMDLPARSGPPERCCWIRFRSCSVADSTPLP